MKEAGVDPNTPDDSLVNPFTSYVFTYDDQKRVATERVRGGQDLHTFDYMKTAIWTDRRNIWNLKTTETLPNGELVVVYCNIAGSLIFKYRRPSSSSSEVRWDAYYEYDELSQVPSFQLILKASANAIQSFTEPANPHEGFGVTLYENWGLVERWNYYPNPGAGGFSSYLERDTVQDGKEGNPVTVRSFTWESHTVGAVTLKHRKEVIVYPEEGLPEPYAPRTTFFRTWHPDEIGMPSFQIASLTTTPPIIPAAQNGTGLGEPVVELYDLDGDVIWIKDARGFITRQYWDPANDAMLRRIVDVDTSLSTDVPGEDEDKWVTPAGGGKHLITDFVSDAVGRTLVELGPAHAATVQTEGDACGGGCVAPVHKTGTVRSAIYYLYLDHLHQRWFARGYAEGLSSNPAHHLMGPVTVTAMDMQSNPTEMIEVPHSCAFGALSTDSIGIDPSSHLPLQTKRTRWIHTVRDRWGRKTEELEYFAIPASGAGIQDVNYNSTRTSYDSLSRPIRVETACGTVNRTVFDYQGFPTQEWVGTDDSGATDANPAGSGAPNNMRQTAQRNRSYNLLTYESFAVKQEFYFIADIQRHFAYDFRNRMRSVILYGSGTSPLYAIETTSHEHDNLDRVVSVNTFSGWGEYSDKLTFRQTISYDNRSRIFENVRYGVFESGYLGEALIAENWYDPDSNVIKSSRHGQKALDKYTYDSLGYLDTHYQVMDGNPSANPPNDISYDTVIEENSPLYDAAGNMVGTIVRERLPNSFGTGALQGAGSQPASRDFLSAAYHDPIGRTVLLANFGTMGGANLVRPVQSPEPSDTVLVSETIYSPGGLPGRWIAPDGVCSVMTYDNRGRPVIQIEALGTGAERVTRTEYAPCGKISRLLVDNPATDQQVTTWTYGSNTETSGVARNSLLAAKIWPDGGTQNYTYDTQGGVKSFADANGTVHEYLVDFKMRLVQDRVTSVAEGIEDEVRRIETVYSERNLVSFVTSWNDPDVGQGTVINQVGFDYNEFDLLTEDRQAHNGPVGSGTATVNYNYSTGSDNVLRRERITYPGGTGFNYDYPVFSVSDALNRPEGISDAYTYYDSVAVYAFAGTGTVAKVGYSGGMFELDYMNEDGDPDSGTALTGYDRFGRTSNILWRDAYGPKVHVHYGYNRNSRRTWREDVTAKTYGIAQDKHYGYDAMGQVREAANGDLNTNRTDIGGIPISEESWEYDSIGNWKNHRREASSVTVLDQDRTSNTSNQIRTIDGSSADVSHDANGNMTRIPHGNSYRNLAWDAWNRLVSVTDDQAYTFAQYEYDGLFRRTKSGWFGSYSDAYYNDQWRQVEETGSRYRIWCWGFRGREDLIFEINLYGGQGRKWCVSDAMDPVAVLDGNLQVDFRMSYTPFGEVEFLAADFTPASVTANHWNFLFHGQFTDPETGYQNYGYRYYVPELGRWPSRDPIGERGGLNLYGFVSNNALDAFDVLGLINMNLMPRFDNPKSDSERGQEITRKALNKYDPTPGTFDVAAHGSPNSILDSEGKPLTPEELADLIKKSPWYKPGMPVKLWSCQTGKEEATEDADTEKPFGKRLAEILGVDVTATDKFLQTRVTKEFGVQYFHDRLHPVSGSLQRIFHGIDNDYYREEFAKIWTVYHK